jgi:hypothetical protein
LDDKECQQECLALGIGFGGNMKPETIALLAGFFGTVLGAAVSVVTILIQQYFQTRREESRLALDAAVKEFSSAEEYASWRNKIEI